MVDRLVVGMYYYSVSYVATTSCYDQLRFQGICVQGQGQGQGDRGQGLTEKQGHGT